MEFKKILVPVDGSEAAGNALHYAVNMARNHGSSITLISVVDANDLLRETNDVMLTDEFMETLKVEGKEIVAQAAKDIPEEIPHDEVTVLGTPGYLIAKHAEEEGVDLIVMGNSGKGAFSSFVTGSVSQYVIHHVKCPVKLIHFTFPADCAVIKTGKLVFLFIFIIRRVCDHYGNQDNSNPGRWL